MGNLLSALGKQPFNPSPWDEVIRHGYHKDDDGTWRRGSTEWTFRDLMVFVDEDGDGVDDAIEAMLDDHVDAMRAGREPACWCIQG